MLKKQTSIFEESVDSWVFNSVLSGAHKFEDILISLPGVYPSIVMESIQRLSSKGLLPIFLLNKSKISTNLIHKPFVFNNTTPNYVPHPMDYDWRFTNSTILQLHDDSCALSKEDDVIVLLGTPSLLENTDDNFQKRKLILMDKNIKAYTKKIKNSYSFKCNVLKEELPHVEAQVVVADPPWYLEHMKAFMWAASQITKIGGYLLLCIPPVGTKPDIVIEINEIFDFAKKLGFSLIEYKPGILSYETPLFEINALKAEGVETIPLTWRRGNYTLFCYESKKNVVRPLTLDEDEWIEIKIKDTRIKVRHTTSNRFNDPSLIQLVPSDILPTVRRSDDRRKKADVWTSGNRIFACNGKNILIPILIALSMNSSPFEIISQILKRRLESKEYDLISSTVKQIDKIVESEQKELKKHLQSMKH